MNSDELTKDTCNALLRGELSAIETYTQAIEKFGLPTEINLLEAIRADHVANAESLRRYVTDCGEEPAKSSGVWGTFATSIEGLATLLGESATLLALQQGEEHGLRQYENALKDEKLSRDVKKLIREILLPSQSNHLIALEGYNKIVFSN